VTKLANHQSSVTTKLLLIGDSGSGKTGALASLAAAGYNLRIADLDNGLDTLANVLSDAKGGYAAGAIDRVSFCTLTDPLKQSGNKLIPAKATAWTRLAKLLAGEEKWGDEDLGPIVKWTSQDVLVIDSLTTVSKAALNFVLQMNVRLGQRPWQSDYGDAQAMVDSLLQMLYDESVKCNVVIIAHIAYIEDTKGGSTHGYPKTIGKALSPTVGTYFNSILQAKTEGFGSQQKRIIATKTSTLIELKNSAPTRAKDKYDLTTGLAEYFKDVRSIPAAAVSGPAAASPSVASPGIMPSGIAALNPRPIIQAK
jgi:AAA domain-containing protein